MALGQNFSPIKRTKLCENLESYLINKMGCFLDYCINGNQNRYYSTLHWLRQLRDLDLNNSRIPIILAEWSRKECLFSAIQLPIDFLFLRRSTFHTFFGASGSGGGLQWIFWWVFAKKFKSISTKKFLLSVALDRRKN